MKKIITLALCATLFSPVMFANESSPNVPAEKVGKSEKHHPKKGHDGVSLDIENYCTLR